MFTIAKNLAFGLLGLVITGSVGVLLMSPGMVIGTTANLGGLQVNTLTEPFSMVQELPGGMIADEILGFHEPALPEGFIFEGTIDSTLVEESSTALLAEILADQAINGEHLQEESSLINLAAAQSGAEIQGHKEFMAEHRYFGSCGAY